MSSIQEKLALVFPQSFQVKRVKKEIQQIQEGKQKYFYDARMSFSRGLSLTFFIQFAKGAFKKYKKLQHIQNFEIKIILKREYPAQSPTILCMSDNMIDFGLQPFRDYSDYLAVQWSAKFTILEVIKIFPEFLENWSTDLEEGKRGKFRVNQSFEVDRIFSWSFLQTFPVKFFDVQKGLRGGLLVISNQKELILLEQYQNRESYCTKDLIRMEDVMSIFRLKQGTRQILLEIKQKDMKQKQSLRFRSDDSDNIVNYLVDYMKLAQTLGKSNQQESVSEESQEEPEITIYSPKKIDIEAIKEEIVIYQSQVENNMTSQNVSNLVILLKKAIEYYSAVGQQDFEIYLQKLKTLMNNEMAQVLLDSASQNQKINSLEKKSPIYPSIVDTI